MENIHLLKRQSIAQKLTQLHDEGLTNRDSFPIVVGNVFCTSVSRLAARIDQRPTRWGRFRRKYRHRDVTSATC